MTPHTLYTLLGLGLLAVAALVVIGVGACRIPRVATAAEEGRPGPSLVWLIVAGLILCAVWSPPGAPLSPGWEHDPIPCAQDCGWNYYYVIVIGALRLLTIAAVALVCAFAAGLLRSMQAWLDNPADTDGVTVTNGQRLARRWRIWRRERALTRALAAHPAAAKGVRITRSRDVFPTSATTSFWLQPAPDSVDDLGAILAGEPLVESVSVHPESDSVELRVTWDLQKLDLLPYTRMPLSIRIAGLVRRAGRRSVFPDGRLFGRGAERG